MQGYRTKLARVFRALHEAWDRGGLLAVAARLPVSRVVPPRLLFVHVFDLLVLGELNARALRPLPPHLELVPTDRAILEELVACTDTPASVELRRQALARVFDLGAKCIALRDAGRLVAYICTFTRSFQVTCDDYGPLTLPIELDDRAVFLGNTFIRPEYRMKGLFPHLLAACIASQPPGTRFFGHIDDSNDHSFRSHRRLGFVPFLTLTCLSLGGVPLFFQRPYGARARRSLVDRRSGVRLLERDGAFALGRARGGAKGRDGLHRLAVPRASF